MADEESGDGNRLATVASLAAGVAFLTLWFWLLPRGLGFRVDTAGAARWRWPAAIPSVLGFGVALRCVWDFGWTGRGTPAPIAPPQRLVIVGFYRYVRNPMYVGFAVGWIGLWIVFGHASPALIAAVVTIALGVHLFVVFYGGVGAIERCHFIGGNPRPLPHRLSQTISQGGKYVPGRWPGCCSRRETEYW